MMADVQNSKSEIKLKIDKVGICDFRTPLRLSLGKTEDVQYTAGEANIYVELSADIKGINMSRLVELMEDYRGKICNFHHLKKILILGAEKLKSRKIFLDINFPYFRKHDSPVSKKGSMIFYDCKLYSEYSLKEYKNIFRIIVPISTLCPCSKAISKYGAHNQRGFIKLTGILANNRLKSFRINDIIDSIENCGSCKIFSLLKRTDEKFVTEKMYMNPKFVEDIAREVCKTMGNFKFFTKFKVEVKNLESIHTHNVYAAINHGFDQNINDDYWC